MKKHSQNIGQKIKEFRISKGFTQQQLELEIGASYGHICRIEKGEINPTKETLLKIADTLSLRLEEKLQLFPVMGNNQLPELGLIHVGGNISFDVKAFPNDSIKVLEINKWMLQIPEIQIIAKLEPIPPYYLLASSMMTPNRCESIAKQIYENYDKYNGFIITHGQDAMTHTASAISFMLQDLNKPIIFTGSLLPIQDRYDLHTIFSSYAGKNISRQLARINIINAVYAASSDIAEVGILYGNQVLRANKSIMVDYYSHNMYQSVHTPALAKAEFGVEINSHCIRSNNKKLIYYPSLEKNVAFFKLYPAFDPKFIEYLIQQKYRGIVLEVMGIGSFPPHIIPSIQKAVDKGIVIVAASNHQARWVDLDLFYTGWIGRDAGVIATKDMTAEAAYTKLMWVLAQTDDPSEIRKMMLTNYAGEITE